MIALYFAVIVIALVLDQCAKAADRLDRDLPALEES